MPVVSRTIQTGAAMRLLLVEDDAMIGQSVHKGLKRFGWSVDWVRDGRAAEWALDNEAYDGVVLDLGLPRKDGLDVLRGQRSKGNDVPVLVITARDAIENRIEGLDVGADDYLVKPFNMEELAARIRALVRRGAGRASPVIAFGDLRLNPATREVTLAGHPLALSARELALLSALIERPGAVLSRAQLEEKLYGWGEEVESNTVEVYIHSLRKKLGADFIKTIRGVGYTVVKSA
jgi:two-component system response regulator QseB